MAIKKSSSKGKPTQAKGAKKKGPAWDEVAKKSEGAFKKARENSDGGGFKIPDIEDGEYTAKPKKFKCGTYPEKVVNGKLKPAGMYVNLTFVISEGDEEGTSIPMRFNPNSDSQLEFMVGQLERFGYDLSALKLAELPDFLKEVCKDAPTVTLAITNDEYEGKKQLKVYINGLV